jgi:hypothetical protein
VDMAEKQVRTASLPVAPCVFLLPFASSGAEARSNAPASPCFGLRWLRPASLDWFFRAPAN